ncbi:hypothetical protein TNCV_3984891 [Trichonephila clavipes]|nr:hypothetical protein TNCV_3984891 [Trichonephila clavipes]
MCLISKNSISVAKENKLKRHYTTNLEANYDQVRFKLISAPEHRRSSGLLRTGGSKFIARKSGPRLLAILLKRPMDKLALTMTNTLQNFVKTH